jgi:hypothetical protein
VAGEVALEQADGVAAAFPFSDTALDVDLGRRVVLAAVEDDGMQCAVELAVAAAGASDEVSRGIRSARYTASGDHAGGARGSRARSRAFAHARLAVAERLSACDHALYGDRRRARNGCSRARMVTGAAMAARAGWGNSNFSAQN